MNLADGLGIQPSALVGQVVTADTGDGGVTQPHLLHRGGDTHGLGWVIALRFRGCDLTEIAASSALVTADQEGGFSIFPTLEDVRTVRLAADGVQIRCLHDLLQILIIRACAGGGADPAGFAFDRGLGVLGLDAEQATSIRMYSSHSGDDTC